MSTIELAALLQSTNLLGYTGSQGQQGVIGYTGSQSSYISPTFTGNVTFNGSLRSVITVVAALNIDCSIISLLLPDM